MFVAEIEQLKSSERAVIPRQIISMPLVTRTSVSIRVRSPSPEIKPCVNSNHGQVEN